MIPIYHEQPGTRLVSDLKPFDKVRCRVTADGQEEWREVLDTIQTQAFVVVVFAAPECPEGEVSVQLPGGLVVPCQLPEIQHGDLATRLAAGGKR